MKNVLVIDGANENLISSINDGTNRVFINDTEINSNEWVGTGNYTATIEGQIITIKKVADLDGNIIIVKLSEYSYELRKAASGGGGGSGGVTSYNDLTDKPSIEGVTLIGDKTHEDLNLQRITNTEIEDLLTLD